MSGAQCLWLHCQVKSSSPQQKSGAGEVNSRFGNWNQKGRFFHRDHWVFNTCCAVNGTVGHAPGTLCLRIHGEWPLEYPTSADLQWSWDQEHCCPIKLWLSTLLSAFMLNLFEWRSQTDNHKELLCKADDYFSYLIISLTCLHWYETSNGDRNMTIAPRSL